MAGTTTLPTKPIWLNFQVIDDRLTQLGAMNEQDRADRLGIDKSTLNRLRRGVIDITLGRVAAMADRIGLTAAEIVVADPKPPSPPPAPPKPPAGPDTGRPPAGPKERQR